MKMPPPSASTKMMMRSRTSIHAPVFRWGANPKRRRLEASDAPRLDSPAATPPGCDGGGHYRGSRNRRAARCDGRSHYGGSRNRRPDDTDSSSACCSEGHPSVSFGCRRFIGLDGGDDRLNRNSSVGDQLATRAPRGRCEWGSPQVLPDQHSGSASRLHGGGEVGRASCRERVCSVV